MRMLTRSRNPHSEDLRNYAAGSTEPWTAELVAALARAIDARRIIETGTFEGKTTALIAEACPDAEIHTVEAHVGRAYDLDAGRLYGRLPSNVKLHLGDALNFLFEWDAGNINISFDDETRLSTNADVDFIFLDDDHSYNHVAAEVEAAKLLLRPGGLLVMHDVVGAFGLDKAVPSGGFVLELPLLHAAGGLGIWQKP